MQDNEKDHPLSHEQGAEALVKGTVVDFGKKKGRFPFTLSPSTVKILVSSQSNTVSLSAQERGLMITVRRDELLETLKYEAEAVISKEQDSRS